MTSLLGKDGTIRWFVALVVIAGTSIPFASVAVSGPELFVPITLVLGAIAELLTGIILFARFRRDQHRSAAMLATTYLALAFLAFSAAWFVPLAPGRSGMFPANPQLAAWLSYTARAGFLGAILVYVMLRIRPDDILSPERARRELPFWFLGGPIVGVAAYVLVTRANDGLPVIFGSTAGSMFRVGGAGPAALVLAVLATGALLRLRRRSEIEEALLLAAFASLLTIFLHLIDDRRFIVSWYAGRLLALLSASFVLVAALRDLLRWRERALSLQDALTGASQRAERHGRRLETLWKLGANPTADDESYLRALLAEGANVLRDGVRFHGSIARREDDEMVLDIVHGPEQTPLKMGDRFFVDDSLLGVVLREGKTISTLDVKRDLRFARVSHLQTITTRGAIATPFRVGKTVYVIGFVAPEAFEEPFSPLDHAYIETLASLCASRLHQRAQGERLRYQADHDALTGLLNRTALRVRGHDALRDPIRAAVVVLSVDRFREVNEAHGPHAGDVVLVDVARRLERATQHGDLVARLGGDTFGILVPQAGTRGEIEQRVTAFHACFAEPFLIGDRGEAATVSLTATAGVAISPDDGLAFEQVLARAEAAAFASKQNGPARLTFFDRRLADAFTRSRRLQSDLARALERNEFDLHFQPHIEIASGRVVGAEALIRWNHPERGLLRPAEFIPFAEEHGLIGGIGAWVMRETVHLSRDWRRADPNFTAWFNLSPVELTDETLLERLVELDESLHGVGVEITETAAMRNVHETTRAIAALRAAGLRIALDDFGTGYSSLAHLKRLPIDVVKIDHVFIAGIPGDAQDLAIVEAVISIGASYGFTTLAEGVEKRSQVAFLARAGCALAQGYAYAHPMPADAFDRWLRDRRQVPGRS